MNSFKVLKTLSMGKGITLRLIENEEAPEDSIDRYVSEATCTGEEPINTPLHWHKKHAEQLTVVEGRVKVTLNGEEHIVKAGDPPVLIARRVVHRIQSFKGETAVLQERPIPGGNYKLMFFNDMLGKGASPGFWHLMRVFYDGDGYISLPLYFRVFDEMFITVFGGIAHLFTVSRPTEL
ncbi:hypothetical protein EV127DRAFT_443326 [Xylaria flabelliformis]|nr:hypothetical protein EV127DRAFT_443326 [Xylaria flabelliformis]KAI0854504.1 hypothetical protein F4860DRAFT_499250 [Xylaria cubensis]